MPFQVLAYGSRESQGLHMAASLDIGEARRLAISGDRESQPIWLSILFPIALPDACALLALLPDASAAFLLAPDGRAPLLIRPDHGAPVALKRDAVAGLDLMPDGAAELQATTAMEAGVWLEVHGQSDRRVELPADGAAQFAIRPQAAATLDQLVDARASLDLGADAAADLELDEEC